MVHHHRLRTINLVAYIIFLLKVFQTQIELVHSYLLNNRHLCYQWMLLSNFISRLAYQEIKMLLHIHNLRKNGHINLFYIDYHEYFIF